LTTHSIETRPEAMNSPGLRSIETRTSWAIASISLMLLALSFGGMWITAVGLKSVAADMGGARSVPSLATSLAWLGSGAGGILMGRIADRYGIRWSVISGSTMMMVGLLISAGATQPWQLYVGHGLFMGLIGNSGLNAPLMVYVSRWFDRRRGSALALISSGGYLAGFVWPTIFERSIAIFGWRGTMMGFAVFQFALIAPLAIAFLRTPPDMGVAGGAQAQAGGKRTVFGWNGNVVFGILAFASFLCCVTMSMPQQHLVAFCTDLGMSATLGAAMLSLLLGMGFFSRQAWGWVSDRIGGLLTALLSSGLQGIAMSGFLFVQGEFSVFAASIAFGIGFSALIPAYILTIRELYPLNEAHWRVPTLMLLSGVGMATGGWLAGYLYDLHGFYTPAFLTGIAFNIANLSLLFMLVVRQRAHAAAVR
jgi:MFS family permease